MGNTVSIVGESGNHVTVDSTSSSLKTITPPHYALHRGRCFSCNTTAAKAETQTQIVRFQSPVSLTQCHMLFKASASLEFKMDIYIDTTLTHVGDNALTIRNRNQNSKVATKSIACHTPAGSGNGTLVFSETVGGSFMGGSIAEGEGFILKRNTAYAIILTSNKAANTVNLTLSWVEEQADTYTTTTTTTSTTSTTSTTTTSSTSTSTTTTATAAA